MLKVYGTQEHGGEDGDNDATLVASHVEEEREARDCDEYGWDIGHSVNIILYRIRNYNTKYAMMMCSKEGVVDVVVNLRDPPETAASVSLGHHQPIGCIGYHVLLQQHRRGLLYFLLNVYFGVSDGEAV